MKNKISLFSPKIPQFPDMGVSPPLTESSVSYYETLGKMCGQGLVFFGKMRYNCCGIVLGDLPFEEI